MGAANPGQIVKLVVSVVALAASIVLTCLFPPAGAWGIGLAIASIGSAAGSTTYSSVEVATAEAPSEPKVADAGFIGPPNESYSTFAAREGPYDLATDEAGSARDISNKGYTTFMTHDAGRA